MAYSIKLGRNRTISEIKSTIPQNMYNNRSTGYSNQQYPKKRSRCSYKSEKQTRNGRPVISAWKPTRDGGLSLVASPANPEKFNSGARLFSDSTNESKKWGPWELWTCKLTNAMGQYVFKNGFYYPRVGRLRIPELNLVASHTTDYFGKSLFNPRNRR